MFDTFVTLHLKALSFVNKHKIFIYCILSFLPFFSFGQNLIPNPGFEDYYCIPDKIAKINCIKEWFSPNAGTPDYYHVKGVPIVRVPENNMGYQEAHDGSAYIGAIFLDKFEGIIEYFQVKLTKPLEQGKDYYFRMYISVADKGVFAISNIGVNISKAKLKTDKWEPFYLNPTIKNPTEKVLSDVDVWYKIDGHFLAKGGEEYLTIGNFDLEDRIKRKQIGQPTQSDVLAYYFIDDLLLCQTCTEEELAEKSDTKVLAINNSAKKAETKEVKASSKKTFDAEIKQGSVITLNNIRFDNDETTLLPESVEEMEKLINLLEEHPSMRIEIRGHTDNNGSEVHNNRLSAMRARAVVNYLTSNSVNANRLRYKGYGSKIPIASNNKEEGRKQNRRVEFMVIKM